MKVLHLEQVTRCFGDFVAVNHLTFSIAEGELVGFLGANGAGKTTTLRMILDILRPTSGTIEVLGGPPGRAKAPEIGFLPEERGLYRGMTVFDSVAYFGRLKGLSRQTARQAAGPLIERFGLDPVNQAVLQDEILAAARRGATIVFSTHVMEHAERLCTRLIMLARGAKVFDGDQEQAKSLLPGRVRLRAQADPSPLPGVARAEPLPATEDGWKDWQVVLTPGTEPGDLLQACMARGFALRDFEAHRATLHDVFLHLAGPQPEPRP